MQLAKSCETLTPRTVGDTKLMQHLQKLQTKPTWGIKNMCHYLA